MVLTHIQSKISQLYSMDKKVEIEASEALLDLGVSLPISVIRVPFTKCFLTVRATMHRPCLGNQIRIARHYLKLGCTYEQMQKFTKEQEMEFVAKHGKRISIMIALTICRGFISGWLFTPFMALFLRWGVKDVFLQGANLNFITLLGTKNFINIIKSIQAVNPMNPRMSQTTKGS